MRSIEKFLRRPKKIPFLLRLDEDTYKTMWSLAKSKKVSLNKLIVAILKSTTEG